MDDSAVLLCVTDFTMACNIFYHCATYLLNSIMNATLILPDMQCCRCGQNNERHPYFASVEARPDLERPNVSLL